MSKGCFKALSGKKNRLISMTSSSVYSVFLEKKENEEDAHSCSARHC
jgi:hypothetical protein